MFFNTITNPDPMHYLKNLNLSNDNKTWVPKINPEELKLVKEQQMQIVLCNDWFSQGSYELGAYSFEKGELVELQSATDAKILNPNEYFIFEEGSSDYKGLIAIGINNNTNFFICHRYFDTDSAKSYFYFPVGTTDSYIDKAIKRVSFVDENISVRKDQKLSVNHSEYNKMIFELHPILV